MLENSRLMLSEDDQALLDGAKGKTLQKIMKCIVKYAEVNGAEKLLNIEGPGHLVMSEGFSTYTGYFNILDELIQNGLKTLFPFTVNPRPIDLEHVPYSETQKRAIQHTYGRQPELEAKYQQIGLRDDMAYSCACYLPQNRDLPKKGQILAWAESSAVVFANSVLGARTNRNAGIMDLFCNIIGKAPEFGFLTDEGRQATWLIEVKTTTAPPATVLGSAIGRKVVADVPYIIELDRFLGKELNAETVAYLKDMGASSAANGAVGLYHVESITPEAREKQRSLLTEGHKTYVIDDQEIEKLIRSYPIMWVNKAALPQACFIGCPHLTLEQIYHWVSAIEQALKVAGNRQVVIPT